LDFCNKKSNLSLTEKTLKHVLITRTAFRSSDTVWFALLGNQETVKVDLKRTVKHPLKIRTLNNETHGLDMS
jgi:hypothetical protein